MRCRAWVGRGPCASVDARTSPWLGKTRKTTLGGHEWRTTACLPTGVVHAALHCVLHRHRYIRKVLSLNVPLAIEDADGDEIIKCVPSPFLDPFL